MQWAALRNGGAGVVCLSVSYTHIPIQSYTHTPHTYMYIHTSHMHIHKYIYKYAQKHITHNHIQNHTHSLTHTDNTYTHIITSMYIGDR